MKLLLTSGGLENKSIIESLRNLVGKNISKTKVVFIPTAANFEEGDKSWLIKDLSKCKELDFEEIDIVNITAVEREIWQPRLERAEVIIMGGGNTLYLMDAIRKTGLEKLLPDLLSSKVYVGISAGSMVMAPSLKEKEIQRLYQEPRVSFDNDDGLGLVDFLVVPHLNSPYFSRVEELVEEVAKDVDIPIYALDDNSAVKVDGKNVEVVGEGKWKKFD